MKSCRICTLNRSMDLDIGAILGSDVVQGSSYGPPLDSEGGDIPGLDDAVRPQKKQTEGSGGGQLRFFSRSLRVSPS